MPLLQEQVAEVQLIQASVGQGEFRWRGSAEEVKAWKAIVAGDELGDRETAPLAFALRLEADAGALWLNVEYRQQGEVQLTLQGPNLARQDLIRVKRVIEERQEEATREGMYGRCE